MEYNVSTIQNFFQPQTKSDIRSFLGLMAIIESSPQTFPNTRERTERYLVTMFSKGHSMLHRLSCWFSEKMAHWRTQVYSIWSTCLGKKPWTNYIKRMHPCLSTFPIIPAHPIDTSKDSHPLTLIYSPLSINTHSLILILYLCCAALLSLPYMYMSWS